MRKKISIITPTFNSQKTIKDTLESVLIQDYPNIEYIIIDGLSQDHTLKILETYHHRFEMRKIDFQIISEKDQGIYDAMNKGIQYASGDIIGFLNSDDFFYSEKSLAYISEAFDLHNPDCVFGNLCLINKNHQIQRYWIGSKYTPYAFFLGWHPAHPTFYVKKEIFQKYGTFNIQYQIASDYDLMLRFLQKHKISSVYISHTLVKMRTGGASNASIRQILKANFECLKIWKNNGLSNFPMFIFLKPLRKVWSLIKCKFTPPPPTK